MRRMLLLGGVRASGLAVWADEPDPEPDSNATGPELPVSGDGSKPTVDLKAGIEREETATIAVNN